MIKKIFLSTLLYLSFAGSVSAQDVNLLNGTSPFNSLFEKTPDIWSVAFVNIAFGFAGVIAFITLLMGGIQWITAGGDKDAIEKSKRRVVNSLIGLTIVFSVYVVVLIIETLFGVNIRQFNIPNI